MSTPTEPLRLSVAIIVRDAAEAVRESLASVRDIADEIVVLDTGSTDATREVAAEFQARVFTEKWADNFAAARNACLEKATGDWVLWLDAGEQLSRDDARKLRDFLSTEADPQKAYVLLVQIVANGPMAAAEQVGRIRLMPRHPGIRYQRRVRETVADSLAANGLQIEGIPLRITRGIREHEPAAKSEKARRNARIAEMEIRENGASPDLLNCLGDAMQTLNDDLSASKFFRHALTASPRGSIEMLEAYYGLVTSLAGDEKNQGAQLALCVEALEIFPLDAQLLCAMGGYLQAEGRVDLAMRAYETAFRHGNVNPVVWHVAEYREIAVVCFSLALQLQKQDEKALASLEEALETNSASPRVRRHLMEFHIRRGARPSTGSARRTP